MLKKIVSNKIYLLLAVLGVFVILTIVASVVSTWRVNQIPVNLNPFTQNTNTTGNGETLNQIEDPVLKFFRDQNSKLKAEMNLVNEIDRDIPTPEIVWKVDFK
ncbi:MAG: hypothetical protein O2871_02130 [bacterium]|nr:hypothetical protein [bacterium]